VSQHVCKEKSRLRNPILTKDVFYFRYIITNDVRTCDKNLYLQGNIKFL